MDNNSQQIRNAGNGLSLGTVLFLIFMTLKLTHYIDWSWWWVTSPLWVAFALLFGIIAVVSVVALPFLLWSFISDLTKD